MATRSDMEFTYSLIDRIFRLSLGEGGDFSGAKYDGDFTLSLEEAQRRKHDFVCEQVHIGPGKRVVDLGCGWGPMLRRIRDEGATGVGLTLSSRQAAACRRSGLDVRIQDCRQVSRETLGAFDGAVSLGAFEHFCSIEDWQQGKQEDVYAGFFKGVHGLLPPGGRFYLQTMVFGRNMLPYEQIDVNAPRGSDAFILGLLTKQFPGSWLPSGLKQVVDTAEPWFRMISQSSGRLDYIETIRQWRIRFGKLTPRKLLAYLPLAPRYFSSRDFRLAFASGISANSISFERELLDHHRIVFERR
ncbi:MAG: class I SAM-dependent methyltransferase [Gemmatimonadales bacterium]